MSHMKPCITQRCVAKTNSKTNSKTAPLSLHTPSVNDILKKLLFLFVCLGAVYSATGEYSIAFFMCGAMAFSSALLLFVVTCMRDEEQFAYKRRRKEEVKEERKKKEEQKKLGNTFISKGFDGLMLLRLFIVKRVWQMKYF